MALFRICPRCRSKVLYGTKCQCEIDRQKQRHKSYKANRTDKKEQEFYNSSLWLDAKDIAKNNTYCIDIYEYYINGKDVVAGDTVHHIIEIKECWDKRLDASNLIYLSNSNHQLIHRLYDVDKVKTQELLFKLLDRFNKEFKRSDM